MLCAVRNPRDPKGFSLDVKGFRAKDGKLELIFTESIPQETAGNMLLDVNRSVEEETKLGSYTSPKILGLTTPSTGYLWWPRDKKYTVRFTGANLQALHGFLEDSREWSAPPTRATTTILSDTGSTSTTLIDTGRSTTTTHTLPDLKYNGPVYVHGYTRKDGTYVRSHTRSLPGTGRRKR